MLGKIIKSELTLYNGPILALIAPIAALLCMLTCLLAEAGTFSGLYLFLGFVGPMVYLYSSAQTKGTSYYSTLPAKRSTIATATVLTTVLLEIMQMVYFGAIALVCSFFESNQLFCANLTSLGTTFVAFGVLNVAMLSTYFAHNATDWAISLAGACAFVATFFATQIPLNFIKVDNVLVLGGYDRQWLWLRCTVFAAGIAIYVVLTVISFVAAKKLFAKKNL